jgi:hypothetical protein
MNFNDASTDVRVGSKTPDRKSNMAGEEAFPESELDREAMDSAQRAQERQHQNENTNSGNTIFSK